MFPSNFAKFLRTSFFIEHFGDCFWKQYFTDVLTIILQSLQKRKNMRWRLGVFLLTLRNFSKQLFYEITPWLIFCLKKSKIQKLPPILRDTLLTLSKNTSDPVSKSYIEVLQKTPALMWWKWSILIRKIDKWNF